MTTATGRSPTSCGRSTRSTGDFYREALAVSRSTREMFCLMEAATSTRRRSTPAASARSATIQLFTDYLVPPHELRRVHERVVPMHDDLFDFFYEALPGLREGRPTPRAARLLGGVPEPRGLRLPLRDMTDWGREMFVTPGIVVDGQLLTTDLVDINLGMRILLGSSFYDDWDDQKMFVHTRPARQPGRPASPWNQTRFLDRRSATSMRSTPGSCRRAGSTAPDHLALDTGGGPLARFWATALAGLVDIGYVKATGNSVVINLPQDGYSPRPTFEWKIPQWSNAIERDRARTYFQAYAAACALHFVEQALEEMRRATRRPGSRSGPDEAHRLRIHRGRARRAVTPHGDSRRQDRQLPPVSPDALERSPRDIFGTPGPTKTPCRTRRSSKRTPPDTSRASTSCGRCAASIRVCLAASTCTSATGRELERVHTPAAFGGGS